MRDISSWADAIYALEIDQPTINAMDFIIPTLHRPGRMSAGIAIPKPYLLGFHNNNCKTCVKATSPDYWALVRKSYPGDFERMAKLSRELDVRLCRISDERRFIDEIPADQPTTNPIQPSCDFLCHIAEQDMVEAA